MQNTNGTPAQQSPLTFYLRTLLYAIIGLFLRVLTFAPLACLAFPAESPWRYLAILCPVLFLFLLLPLRFSFADALVQDGHKRYFSFDTALSLSRYGEKLGESLLHALNVLKWGIPLALLLVYYFYCYSTMDVLSLFRSIPQLGTTATTIWYGIANFFLHLFGSSETLVVTGTQWTNGLYVILGGVGLGLLVMLYGAMRNSATRYIWALASHTERNLRSETRRRLRGRRGRQFLMAMVNLVLWVPFGVALFPVLTDVAADLSTALMNSLTTGKLNLPDLSSALAPLLFAFFVLYLPLLPVRRYLSAFFATKRIRHAAPKKPATGRNQATSGVSMPMAAPVDAPAGDDTNRAVSYPAPAYSTTPQASGYQPYNATAADAPVHDAHVYDGHLYDAVVYDAQVQEEAPAPAEEASVQAEPAPEDAAPSSFTIGQ